MYEWIIYELLLNSEVFINVRNVGTRIMPFLCLSGVFIKDYGQI